ncbi:MAG: hypothetical protein C0501_07920 [Isosphaera sp.]|nr:hypothetical protein [Isosphaera sp.]
MLTALGLGLLVLLAVVALPHPRVRQAVLGFAARAGQAAVLAAVAACGTLFVRPDAAPPAVAPYADRLAAEVRRLLPDPAADWPGVPWLVVAAAVVALALPVISVLEFAARVMGQTAVIQSLRKELRRAADALDRRLAGLSDAPPPADVTSEVAAAADAMRAVAGGPRKDRPAAPRLVRDLL